MQGFLIETVERQCEGNGRAAEKRGPEHKPANGVPFELTVRIGAREQSEVAEPPRRQAHREHHRDGDLEIKQREHDGARNGDGKEGGPVAPADGGDHDRQASENHQQDRGGRPENAGDREQRRSCARANTDEYVLHHRKLSRFNERLEPDASGPTIGTRDHSRMPRSKTGGAV